MGGLHRCRPMPAHVIPCRTTWASLVELYLQPMHSGARAERNRCWHSPGLVPANCLLQRASCVGARIEPAIRNVYLRMAATTSLTALPNCSGYSWDSRRACFLPLNFLPSLVVKVVISPVGRLRLN